jgi:hypothetical protein
MLLLYVIAELHFFNVSEEQAGSRSSSGSHLDCFLRKGLLFLFSCLLQQASDDDYYSFVRHLYVGSNAAVGELLAAAPCSTHL